MRLIILLFCIGLALRIYPSFHHIVFPYDQARDALMFQDMVNRTHLPLLGPVTDIPGVHHGPLFYLLMIPLYALSNSDPWLPVFFLMLVNLSTMIPLYFFTKEVFHDKRVTIITLVLFIVSYEMISYSKWISNPVLAVPLFATFLLLLWRVWKTQKKQVFWLGLVFGLLVQSEIVLAYLLFPCYVILSKGRVHIKQWLLFHLGVGVGILPYLVAELKYHFQAINALIHFLGSTAQKNPLVFFTTFRHGISILSTLVRNNLFGLPPISALLTFAIITVLCFFAVRKTIPSWKPALHFLYGMLACGVGVLMFGKSPEIFFFAGFGSILLIIAAVFLVVMMKEKQWEFAAFITCIILASQIALTVEQARAGNAYIQAQKGVLFDQRLQVLDAIYTRVSSDTPFTISVFGTPYGVRTSWAYYFSYYSSHQAVILPKWYGYTVNGFIGDDILPHVDAPARVHIAVYEPEFSIAPQYKDEFTAYQNAHTTLVERFTLNNHTIEIRKPK